MPRLSRGNFNNDEINVIGYVKAIAWKLKSDPNCWKPWQE